MTAKAPILIDVGRGKLLGEIDWWFLTPQHITNFVTDVIHEPSLAHRVGMIYIACSWHRKRERVLPDALLLALAAVLELRDLPPNDAEMTLTDGPMLEGQCDAIIGSCEQRTTQRAVADERRRRAPGFQPLKMRVTLFRMIRHFALIGIPTPEPVLTAMCHLLGLVSWKTGRPLPSAQILRRLGLPSDVDRWAVFVEAARLDGAAMVGQLGEGSYETLAPQVSRMITEGGWAISCNGLSTQLGVSRSTIKSWRGKPQYRRFVSGALMPALEQSVWANHRRRYPKVIAT